MLDRYGKFTPLKLGVFRSQKWGEIYFMIQGSFRDYDGADGIWTFSNPFKNDTMRNMQELIFNEDNAKLIETSIKSEWE